MKTKTLASLSFAEIIDREITASGKSHGQVGRESGIQDTLIGMYRNGHREPTLRNTRRLCVVFPELLTWIAAGSDLHDTELPAAPPEPKLSATRKRAHAKPTKKAALRRKSKPAIE
jgi:hypothetical protein